MMDLFKYKTYITFGYGHLTADGQCHLANVVAVSMLSEEEARQEIVKLRGDKWAFSYPREEAMTKKFIQLALESGQVIDLDTSNADRDSIVLPPEMR